MTTPSYKIHFAHTELLEDAVALLREKSPEFIKLAHAEIKVGATQYPDFMSRKFALLVGPLDAEGNGHIIGITSAEEFTGRQAIRPDRRRRFAIDDFDGAIVDELSNVTLSNDDETRLYDVRLTRTSMPADVTTGEEEALLIALMKMGKKPILNYTILPSFRRDLPPLKQLPYYPLMRERYRSAFLKTGLRPPRYRKHSG